LSEKKSTFSQRAVQDSNFSGQQPEDHRDRLGGFIIAWDGNINVLQIRIRVGQRNDWDVHVRGLDDSLSISICIDNNHQPWLLELFGHMIGEDTWGPPGVTGSHTSGVMGEFDDGSLAKISGRDNDNILGHCLTGDQSRSQSDFVIGFLDFEDGDTLGGHVVDKSLHCLVIIDISKVALFV
jgi:hypothetical protein